MASSIHEHQWAYFADIALAVTRKETDVNLRRGEYCVGCSTLRVLFPSGWYIMQGDATKSFLKQFDREIPGKVLKLLPTKFKPRPPKRDADRLGKSLKDLMNESHVIQLPKK